MLQVAAAPAVADAFRVPEFATALVKCSAATCASLPTVHAPFNDIQLTCSSSILPGNVLAWFVTAIRAFMAVHSKTQSTGMALS